MYSREQLKKEFEEWQGVTSGNIGSIPNSAESCPLEFNAYCQGRLKDAEEIQRTQRKAVNEERMRQYYVDFVYSLKKEM